MKDKVKVSVYGATGFTGRELLKILHGHPSMEINRIYSRTHEGRNISDIFPSLKGMLDMKLEAPSTDKIEDNSDAVFLALPHETSMKYVPALSEKKILAVDMSADYRFSDYREYEDVYGIPHTDRENLKKAVYGIPEINPREIEKAELIANPGCYATAVILSLFPLVKEGVLKGPAFADAKSGISGAGKKLHDEFLFAKRYENITPYKVNSHRHMKEITSFIKHAAGVKWENLVFCPHLIPVERGILANIYAPLSEKLDCSELHGIYAKYYKEKPFINIYPEGKFPQTSDTVGTNNCGIGAAVSKEQNAAVIIASIDNLIKGASGQAVQNMNIAMGFGESEGLR